MTSSSPRALLTGARGFAGRHVAARLSDLGFEVVELVRSAADTESRSSNRLQMIGDVTDFAFLRDAIGRSRPEVVMHLAAVTGATDSEEEARRLFEVNVEGTRLLLEALRLAEGSARILVTSSSAVYGTVPRDLQPITEETPLRPQTPYAASKACQEIVALAFQRSRRASVVVTRAFNHTGPGERATFAASGFAHQIAEIEAGLRPPVLRVGNLEAFRDFCDVRDVARAYVDVALRGESGECYNVASGVARRMADVLDCLRQLSRSPVRVEIDPERFQASDVPYQCGSSVKLERATVWRPEIPFEKTLIDLLDYWRARVALVRRGA